MSERVHVHSWPLDRDFTFKEWCEYLREHSNDADKTVFQYEGFRFNVHGYCFNPREVKIYLTEGDSRIYAAVRIFAVPERRNGGGWEYRCDANELLFGGSAGWGMEQTEADAIRAGLRKLREKYCNEIDRYCGRTYFDKDGNEYGYTGLLSRLRRMRNRIEDELQERIQLSLFD